MATTTSNFPTDIDTFAPITAGPSGTRMNDASEPASAIITHIQAALTAIQNVLGTDDGAVAGSVLRRLLLLSDADVPATVVTNATSSRTIASTDAGKYIRFTATGAKTCTFDNTLTAGEYHIRNAAASGGVTLTASSTTLNAPAGGTLVLEPGMTCTVKFIGTAEFDVFGQTVAA